MRLPKKALTLVVLSAVVIVALGLSWHWCAYSKRSVDSFFTRRAAFTFADIPQGRALTAAEIDGYARRLLAEMSLEEKVLHMSGDSRLVDYWPFLIDRPLPAWPAGADRHIGVPPIVASDGPRGVGVEPRSTCFPVAMARGASWDRALEQRVADVVGKEMRAHDANLWLAPCINLVRHPLGGRSQESYGEDPFLLGEMAVAAIAGVQRHNVMACAKHYALNSIEETRQQVDVRADERTLREVYLPHFKRAVDAGVTAVMSSYNKVNGDYASENRHLLREILKREWGFRGFVVSDWDTGVHDGVKAANAGLDLEMPLVAVYGPKLVAAARSGQVAAELIDEAVLRLLRARIDYATRLDPLRYDARLIRAPEHVALAREVAEKGAVLLKNEGVLPLDRNSIHSLAVLGALADAEILGDHGSSRVRPPTYVTPLAGLRAALGASAKVLHEPGLDPTRAKTLARSADAVIVVAGFDYRDEGEHIPQARKADEGGDRDSLGLRPADQALIQAVAGENPKTVVVLVGGAAITVEEWHEAAGAILMAFYPGERGGEALARILFGEVNPSGKLPFTVPRDASQLPPFDNTSLSVDYGYYHGYTLVEKRGWEPRYPFGHGLSYTTFRHANLALDAKEMKADGEIEASIDVTNTGPRSGEEVVQLYVGLARSQVDRPQKLLRAFEKVGLAPGETKRVTLRCAAKDLAYYDPETRSWVVERMEHEVLVGPSSRAADLLRASFAVVD